VKDAIKMVWLLEKKTEAPVRRFDRMAKVVSKRARGRPEKTGWEALKFDIKYMSLIDDKAMDIGINNNLEFNSCSQPRISGTKAWYVVVCNEKEKLICSFVNINNASYCCGMAC